MEASVLKNMTIEDRNLEEKNREEFGEKRVPELRKDLAKWRLKLKESETNIRKRKNILKSREAKANDKEALVSNNVLNLKKTRKAPQAKMKDVKNKEKILLELDDEISTIREFLTGDVSHMFSCMEASCSLANCKELKELEELHGPNSECYNRPLCKYCKNFEYVLRLHASSCQVPGCHVPTCRDLHGKGRE